MLLRSIRRIFSSRNLSEQKKSLLDLNCKIVTIFGGTGGIGSAIGEEILHSTKIKHVVLVDKDIKRGKDVVEKLNCTYGSDKSTFFKGNIENSEEIETTLNDITRKIGKIDVIVNAAGIWDAASWQKELNTNLIGTMNVNLSALQFINNPGIIINIAGLAGVETFYPTPTLSAGFSGIVAFSRCLGHDVMFKGTGVRIVVLCTGATATDFNKESEKFALYRALENPINNYLKSAHWQKVDSVAKSVVILIESANSGSVWVVEDSKLYKVKEFINWKGVAGLEAQFL